MNVPDDALDGTRSFAGLPGLFLSIDIGTNHLYANVAEDCI